MKRFHWAICSAIALSFGICSLVYQTKLNNLRELNAAYERGVRWGERERKHLVVFEGVTNKYDTINEAMSNAVSGASIYLAAGIHYVGPHGMAVSALDNLSVYGSTNDTLTDARGKRIGTTINAEWSGVTNNAVEKKEP